MNKDEEYMANKMHENVNNMNMRMRFPKMRSREEIEKDCKRPYALELNILEVLLDIRDLLLEKQKPKGKSREEYEKKF